MVGRGSGEEGGGGGSYDGIGGKGNGGCGREVLAEEVLVKEGVVNGGRWVDGGSGGEGDGERRGVSCLHFNGSSKKMFS